MARIGPRNGEIALPKRSNSQCPSGGDYKFNPVGTKPECSFHGDDF
jgi:hypothetical protein